MCWTWYIDFIWNTFLFQCVGVDPQISSASAAPSSVSPAARSLVFSKSIRFIFLMSAIFRPEIILRFISPGTLWDSFVNSLRMIYHLWILSPLLLIFPNQTQSEFRSISAFSGNNICFAVYHKMKRGYLKVWFCHSVWKCMLEMMEIALHCVIPKSVIAYCFANHISHCLILITVNGFRCFVTQRKYQRRDKKTK